MTSLGIISDTHGHLDSKVFGLFEGVDQILHAGDIGDERIIVELEALAPVTAVHGNVDGYSLAHRYPERQTVQVEGIICLITHIFQPPPEQALPADVAAFDLIIFGHTHHPFHQKRDSTLFLNPGSAGLKRFSLPRTVALLKVTGQALEVEFLDLEGDA